MDRNIKVVNPEQSNITYQIKKERETMSRRKANPYQYKQQDSGLFSEQEHERWMKKQLELNKESKALQNLIKMIGYRAETDLAALIRSHYKRSSQEIKLSCRHKSITNHSPLTTNH